MVVDTIISACFFSLWQLLILAKYWRILTNHRATHPAWTTGTPANHRWYRRPALMLNAGFTDNVLMTQDDRCGQRIVLYVKLE